MRNRPMIPCLVPDTIDFGAVAPSQKIGGIGGVCNWARSGQVKAQLMNDTSGGLFTDFMLGVYDVESVAGNQAQTRIPVQWQLVEVASGDGSQDLPVAQGQTVAVSLFFSAARQATGKTYTATIQILAGGATIASIPVSAVVGAPDVVEHWEVANPFGIAMKSLSATDPLDNLWHAGHVNDVLVLTDQLHKGSGALFVANDAGGISLVKPTGGSGSPGEQYRVGDWKTPGATCLCQGPDGPGHVYAAGFDKTAGGILFETADLSTWRDISSPLSIGYVYKIVITASSPRRIVIACDSGVFWALIPQSGSQYVWVSATMQRDARTPTGRVSGLALGPRDRVIVAAFGAVVDTNGLYGIFQADWNS